MTDLPGSTNIKHNEVPWTIGNGPQMHQSFDKLDTLQIARSEVWSMEKPPSLKRYIKLWLILTIRLPMSGCY